MSDEWVTHIRDVLFGINLIKMDFDVTTATKQLNGKKCFCNDNAYDSRLNIKTTSKY